MAVVTASRGVKTVADPIAEYESLLPMWKRARAVCGGESSTKDFDRVLDVVGFRNLLIPFSPTMSHEQYVFYKAEAEMPGITAEFSKMLVGGLLRKPPTVKLPDGLPTDALDWITKQFSQDDTSLMSFLDEIIYEEIQTTRSWVYVDYPTVENADDLTPEEQAAIKPYPIVWQAESVINWSKGFNSVGKVVLTRVITRAYEESFDENEFHPSLLETVKVHELDENGFYQIRVFQQAAETTQVVASNGTRNVNDTKNAAHFEQIDLIDNILMNGERLTFIPAWPLNGQIKPTIPVLTAVIDKEISLYNKMSRRNHLLYGASTYTPIISSDMLDEDFDKIVNAGLGSWIKLGKDDTATVLETPTAALADMDRSIASNIEEMAKLGIRMLSPETAQSGIALELRNAAQTARLGALSNRINATMTQVIAFMLNWRYGTDVKDSDITFKLSEDFNATPLGADWVRLATEWYQQALIPRSVWLQILKQNDMVQPEYDDEQGREEITKDQEAAMANQGSDAFASSIGQPPTT